MLLDDALAPTVGLVIEHSKTGLQSATAQFMIEEEEVVLCIVPVFGLLFTAATVLYFVEKSEVAVTGPFGSSSSYSYSKSSRRVS